MGEGGALKEDATDQWGEGALKEDETDQWGKWGIGEGTEGREAGRVRQAEGGRGTLGNVHRGFVK
jgi:hypothetical protein